MAKMKRSQYYGNVCFAFALALLFGGIITMISILALYISYPVEQSEYAVGYDTYNMEFTKIYEQGKYPIRVGEEMIIIQRTLQDFNKDLTCMTKDKILINLSIGLQYQYHKDDLIYKILKEFSSIDNFNGFLFDRMTSSIINSCLAYEAEEYYTERSVIDRHIYNGLVAHINDYNLGATVGFFQLINIQFPVEISNAIAEKQNIDQEALTAQNERASKLTEANTALYEMQRLANIQIINAYASANITQNQAQSNSQIQQVLWENRAYTYSHANHVLGLNSTQLIDYIQSDLISKSDNLLTNLNFN
jgi:regulator of protease activity HflC (stomatin/prohibitin superfamily)